MFIIESVNLEKKLNQSPRTPLSFPAHALIHQPFESPFANISFSLISGLLFY